MKIRYLLFAGSMLAGGIGHAAAATSVDTQDLGAVQHATVDTLAGHDVGGMALPGDAVPAHDSSVPPSDSSGTSAVGGSSAHPQVTHRQLGWQSLLPGSIQ